jgi:hypothetical protein
MTTKSDLLKAIRARCLDCSCYQPGEVAQCPAKGCALWPYRAGRDPSPARGRLAENLASVGAVLANARSGKGKVAQ